MANPTDDPRPPRRPADWDPLADHPIGPDDAGNALAHGLGLLSSLGRWLRSKLPRR